MNDFKIIDTLDKALVMTMATVDELKEHGVVAKIRESKSRKNQATLDKYANREGRLNPELWYHITLCYEETEQAQLIAQAAKRLGALGICFDTGGWNGERDWEIDWSFRLTYSNSKDVSDMAKGREAVEQLLQQYPASPGHLKLESD